MPVENEAAWVRNMRWLNRYDEVSAGMSDYSVPGISITVLESEFERAFACHIALAFRFGSAPMAVVVAGAEPNRRRVSMLLDAHLKDRLTAQKLLVCVLAGKALRVRRRYEPKADDGEEHTAGED